MVAPNGDSSMAWLMMTPRLLLCAFAPRLTATRLKKTTQKTISVHLGLYAYSRSTPPIGRFLCCLTMVAPAFFHPQCLWQHTFPQSTQSPRRLWPCCCCNVAKAFSRRACRLSGPCVTSQRYTVAGETPSCAANWATDSPCLLRSRATDLPVGRIFGVPVATLAAACLVVVVGCGDGSRRIPLRVACGERPAGIAARAILRPCAACDGCRVLVAAARLVARDGFFACVCRVGFAAVS